MSLELLGFESDGKELVIKMLFPKQISNMKDPVIVQIICVEFNLTLNNFLVKRENKVIEFLDSLNKRISE